MTVAGSDRFPDIAVPSILPLPPPPETPEEAVEYIKTLHEILGAQQVKLARALTVLSHYRTVQGETYELPTPVGSGATFIDVETKELLFDQRLTSINQEPRWLNLTAESPLGTDKVAEPVILRGSGPPLIDIGDDVVVQNDPHDPVLVDSDSQPNQFLWTPEGDIIMTVVVK